MASFARDIRENPFGRAFWLFLLAGFGYGVLHALGPGHGKSFICGYFLSRKGNLLQGLAMGTGSMLAHVASAALMVSDVPFAGPLAAVRVGRIGGQFVCNPTKKELAESDMNIVVAGTKDAIVMVEGGANEVPETEIVDALMFAHESIQEFVKLQEDLISGLDVEKRQYEGLAEEDPIQDEILTFAGQKLKEAFVSSSKAERRPTRCVPLRTFCSIVVPISATSS